MTRIAYLASLYPAPSHTFIEREIRSLERTGIQIIRFSVRRPASRDITDATAREELSKTRWLVPPDPVALVKAAAVAVATRPGRLVETLREALSGAGSWGERLKWLGYWGEAILLADWIRSSGASHIHCHFGNAGSNTAAIAAKLAGVPFSVTFHGIDLDEPERYRHRVKLEDCVFAVCISSFGRRTLLNNSRTCDAGKVRVVRCGLPLPPPEQITALPGRNHIVCVARLSPEKGHQTLVAALARLKQRGLFFTCTLVGGGPLDNEIRERIALAGLARNVEMVGIRTPAQVQAHIAEADLVVLASYGEGIPIALLEAFALKRPVVATRVGGIPELVQDAVNGRLVAPRNEAALADAIEAVLTDRESAIRMGEVGWQRVAAQHSIEASARKMKELLTGTAPDAAVPEAATDQIG